SRLGSPQACKQVLQEKHPDDPPESIGWKTNRLWRWYSDLHVDDIIAVPLLKSRELAVAEVTGPYQYRDGVHVIPVKWHEKRVPALALRKHKELLQGGGEPMYEVTKPD